MQRAQTSSALDEAVKSSRTTLLQGLPRVGRSELARRWCEGRDDAQFLLRWADGPGSASIRVVDQLRLDDVDNFVDTVKALDSEENKDIRYVVLPKNLAAAHRLREDLAGNLSRVDLPPLQLDDYAAAHLVVDNPTGPSAIDLVPEPSAINRPAYDPDLHWLRGGFPQSLNAETDKSSFDWRLRMIDDVLVGDFTRWSITAAIRLPEILRWIASQNGNELNEAGCPIAKRAELMSVLYVFDELRLTRRLLNFAEGGVDTKAPKQKIYIRDSGILNALLEIETVSDLRMHLKIGECFEAYALECLILASGLERPYFYRRETPEGADEIDLLLDFRRNQGPFVAIEFKTSDTKGVKPGFHRGIQAIGATHGFAVHSGPSPIRDGKVERLDLASAIVHVRELSTLKL